MFCFESISLFFRRIKNLPHPYNVPYSPALFLASPKKKGEKEGRRSARGRFFHEPLQWRQRMIVP